MRNATFAGTSMWSILGRRLAFGLALAGAMVVTMLAIAGVSVAWAEPTTASGHTDPDYLSITGARVGAPSEQDVSTYGGSHKHLRVEQQLYGPGVVHVPDVDTTVHQSR